MRTIQEIRAEIEQASEQRSELWEQLANGGPDAEASAEVARLSEQINDLWAEERAMRARQRFGPSEDILTRARAEDRLEREARRLRHAA